MEGLTKLGIDGWSILIYLVNTGILLAILTKFLYKPILTFLDKRKETIENKLNEADHIKTEFEKKLLEMEAEKDRAQRELKKELEQMKSYVEKKKAELKSEIDTERQEMLEKTSQEIEKRQAELLSNAEKQTKELILKIVMEIVHNKVPENIISESIEESWKRYN